MPDYPKQQKYYLETAFAYLYSWDYTFSMHIP